MERKPRRSGKKLPNHLQSTDFSEATSNMPSVNSPHVLTDLNALQSALGRHWKLSAKELRCDCSASLSTITGEVDSASGQCVRQGMLSASHRRAIWGKPRRYRCHIRKHVRSRFVIAIVRGGSARHPRHTAYQCSVSANQPLGPA